MLIFDIETAPLPEEQLRELLPPLDESAIEGLVTGDFDPASVKCGNLKDQAKINEKIEAARVAHEAAKDNAASILKTAKEKHWQDFLERAALSAITGRVLAVGYLATESGKFAVDHGNGDEKKLLSSFWSKYAKCRQDSRKMVGHNVAGFDVPFLLRRSWILEVDVPETVLDRNRYLDPIFVDTMALWGCGSREAVKLDVLGQVLGVGRKLEGVDGAMFHKLWFGTEDDRAKAVEYLVQDLRLTAAVAGRMCLI